MLSFTERMEQGRDIAQERRNRGLPTGTPAPGWVVKRRPDPETGSWERLAAEVSRDWKFARDEALEAFRFAVYPERYEAIEL